MKFRVSTNRIPFIGKWRAGCILNPSVLTAPAVARSARDVGRRWTGATAGKATPPRASWLATRVAMSRSSYRSSLPREATMSSSPALSTAIVLKVDFAANARRRVHSSGRPQSYEANGQFYRCDDTHGHFTAATPAADLSSPNAECVFADRAARSATWTAVTVTVMAGIFIRALWKL
jgi:hypothetical protein